MRKPDDATDAGPGKKGLIERLLTPGRAMPYLIVTMLVITVFAIAWLVWLNFSLPGSEATR